MSVVHTRDGKKVPSSVVRVSRVHSLPPVRASVSPKPAPLPQQAPRGSDKDLEATTPKCRAPLGLILLGQCLLVAGIFATLVAVVTVRVTSTTKSLVEERILSDLEYSKGSILSPIETSQQLIMAHRLRYIAYQTEKGYPMCNESSYELSDSKDFMFEAMSSATAHAPAVGFVYVMHKSTKYSHLDGTPQTFECGAALPYMYVRTNTGAKTSNGPVTFEQTINGFANVTTTFDGTTDYGKVAYFVSGMKYTDFGFLPYLFVQQGTGISTLYLGGYVPIYVNRTLANGTVETFAPDLTVPQANKHDPSLTPISTIASDINLAHVNNLMVSITPPTDGSHTSLYDLRQMVLLATSVQMIMMNANHSMWPAGSSSSADLNSAFVALNPRANSNSTTRIIYHKDRILSAIYISTTSEIDFIIIQSTPITFYLGTVYSLRTLMIVLGVCAAAFVVVVCVGLALLISRKIAEIEAGMLLAAVLKNDQVQPCRSFIAEMDTLCVAFAHMNAKLGAARAFMPQSMLVSDEGSGGDGEGEDEGSHGPSTQTPTQNSISRSDQRSQRSISWSQSNVGKKVATLIGEATTVTKDSAHSKEQAGLKIPFQSNGLISKKVTILSLNTIGFHRRTADPYSVSTVTTDLTSAIYEICVGHRGVIDSFHGDHYILSFNAAKHNAQGPQTAARCGLDIIEALGPKVGFSMGVAAGRALVGHLGSTELKRFSIIGRVYSQAIALERVCKLVSAEGTKGGYSVPQLLADKSVTPDIEHSNFLQVLGKMENGAENLTIYGVLGSSESGASNEEWLYEVMNSDSANGSFDTVLPAVNTAMEVLLASGSVIDNMPRFSSAIIAAADLATTNRAPLVGREHGQQALLRAMAVQKTSSAESVVKHLIFSL